MVADLGTDALPRLAIHWLPGRQRVVLRPPGTRTVREPFFMREDSFPIELPFSPSFNLQPAGVESLPAHPLRVGGNFFLRTGVSPTKIGIALAGTLHGLLRIRLR
jgi:hypothetical protein